MVESQQNSRKKETGPEKSNKNSSKANPSVQHMGVSAFPSRAALCTPSGSEGAALMWLQPLPRPLSPPVLCQALGSGSGPSQPLPRPGSLSALRAVAGAVQGAGAEGTQGLGAPGRAHSPTSCPVPGSLCQMDPSAVRAAQPRLPPLPACFAITAGSPGRWGLVEWLRGQGWG